MSKGGYRGTTWGSSWKHGKTIVIRVPEILVDDIMNYARQLDDGENNCLVTGNAADEILKAIDSYIKIRQESYRPNQHSQKPNITSRAWDELRKFQKLLQENPQALGLTPGTD
jgi:hypothetical protein